MLPSTLLPLLLTAPLLALGAPAPIPSPKKPLIPSGIDLTVYDAPNCKGHSHKRTNIKYNDKFQDSPASKSYKLSKDLGEHDYLTFESTTPYVASGKDREKDVHFSHPHIQNDLFPKHVSLHLLAIVETANIPLCLVAGPSLDVWTNNETTHAWLHDCLIDDELDDEDYQAHWREERGGQSQYGILLQVDGTHRQVAREGLTITEILLYAAVSTPSSQTHVLPSPPASSSPLHNDLLETAESQCRLYALPLSSHIFQIINHAPPFQQPDSESLVPEFFYLPNPLIPLSQPNEASQARKRPKIEMLFNDAAQHRRLQKKRGGEGIAKAMAVMIGQNATASATMFLDQAQAREKTKPPFTKPTRGSLSRASTTGSITSLQSNVPGTTRPQSSRRPTLSSGPRSSLRRIESALSPSLDGTDSPIPEEDPNSSAVEQQNKDTLSRITMAGMRMYGFQPQRKKSVGSSVDAVPTTATTGSALAGGTSVGGGGGQQDEYKALYHQTFKAASFVFRKYWARRVVGQDLMRDTVDGFLGVFCRDPFGAGGSIDTFVDGDFSEANGGFR
ncbi:MAG: hypothetical protein Q9219_001579 [cf. Caloplaca sp. 3 TL-2023]